jgi:response regulator RpfG family c-di-GMP phosphodiesterase
MASLAALNEMTGQQPTRPARLLIVDDEDTIRLVLAKFLRTRGFEVATAESGDAALEALSNARFDLMLCDVRMPGLSGVEVVPAALEIDPDLGIVMLSAVNDAPTATEALASGVLDYLIKPIELQKLHEAVSRALDKRSGLRDQHRVERVVREQVASRTSAIERERTELREVTVRALESVVSIMEARDAHTHGNSARVAELAGEIGEYMGLGPDVVEDIRVAGRLRDIGNVGIRTTVLGKPGPLTPEEIAHVREHVRIGLEILQPLSFAERVIGFVADHHERWDGAGYPQGRSGEHLSAGGRILAAAGAFESLISKRPHRAPMTPDAAIEQLRRDTGTCFDPRVFEALRVVVKRRTAS